MLFSLLEFVPRNCFEELFVLVRSYTVSVEDFNMFVLLLKKVPEEATKRLWLLIFVIESLLYLVDLI